MLALHSLLNLLWKCPIFVCCYCGNEEITTLTYIHIHIHIYQNHHVVQYFKILESLQEVWTCRCSHCTAPSLGPQMQHFDFNHSKINCLVESSFLWVANPSDLEILQLRVKSVAALRIWQRLSCGFARRGACIQRQCSYFKNVPCFYNHRSRVARQDSQCPKSLRRSSADASAVIWGRLVGKTRTWCSQLLAGRETWKRILQIFSLLGCFGSLWHPAITTPPIKSNPQIWPPLWLEKEPLPCRSGIPASWVYAADINTIITIGHGLFWLLLPLIQ